MEEKEVIEALKKLREKNTKRKFTQSLDLSFSFKQIDLKKPENKINDFINLPYPRGRKIKVCALVDKDLLVQARKDADLAISKDEFNQWSKNPRKIKNLARDYDYFLAQATIMPEIAKHFGKYLGTAGKMPSPKAGCVIPPKAELINPIIAKLQKTVRIKMEKTPSLNTLIGTEEMKDEELAKNALAVINAVSQKLPGGSDTIKSVHLKFTMSPSVKI